MTDSGEGISPEFLPYVFDRFRQADSSNTRQYGGLGLGLAIIKNLVEAHGGTVRVESPGIGQGTTLTIALPLITATITPEASTSALPIGENLLCDLRVLVVEDNVDSLDVLTVALETQGATVATATSVAEAIRKFAAEPALDLLISDINLPDEDGFELIRWVRSLPAAEGGDVLAIAVTGYAAARDTENILAAGFQRYLAKPITLTDLLTVIVGLLD